MPRLTDPSVPAFAGRPEFEDYVHLVDKSDTSQDPAGSSKRATLEFLLNKARTRVIYQGAHGNDSLSGLTPEESVLTLPVARTKAIALSPTPLNPVTIEVVDGPVVNVSGIFSVPEGIILYMPRAEFSPDTLQFKAVNPSSKAVVICRTFKPTATYPTKGIDINSTTGGTFYLICLNEFKLSANGIGGTKGTLHIIAPVQSGGTPFELYPNGTNVKLYLDTQDGAWAGAGGKSWINSDGDASIYVNVSGRLANDTAGDMITSSGSAEINVSVNETAVAGKLYNISGDTILNCKPLGKVTEGIESTVSGNAQVNPMDKGMQVTDKTYVDYNLSAGFWEGAALTDNGDGTIDVAAGTGFLRNADTDTASIKFYPWSAAVAIALTDGQSNYVYIDYNAGSPQIDVTTNGESIRDNENNKFELYEIVREGTILHITDHRQYVNNALRRIQQRIYEVQKVTRASGLIIGETGDRNISVSEGVIWVKLDKSNFANFNTAIPTPNSTCAATYESTLDLSYGAGNLTSINIGSPTLNSGKLDLRGAVIKGVKYNATSNADFTQTACLRMQYIPNYSGTPASDQYMFNVSDGVTANNLIELYHQTGTGNLFMNIFDSTGTPIISVSNGAFNPTSGQQYEIELNFDITTGATRVFIDGVQAGITYTNTGTRTNTADTLTIGNSRFEGGTPDFQVENFILFDAVQHTTTYTPDAAILLPNTFDRYYSDGGSGWTKQSAESQWDNTQYDDGSGSLATMNNNRYSNQYFYAEPDGNVVSLYGQAEYVSLAGAQADPKPSSVPIRIDEHSVLVGRIVFQKNDTTAQEVESSFTTTFSGSQVTDHGDLSGLPDNDHPQYARPRTNMIYVDLTSGQAAFAGTTPEYPLNTITNAMAEVATLRPSPDLDETYVIKVLGGGLHSGDFAMLRYTTLDMGGATLEGNITLVQDSTVYLGYGKGPLTGSGISFQMSGSQPDGAHVYIGAWAYGGLNGMFKNTSNGPIFTHFSRLFQFSGTSLIAPGNTGDIYINGLNILTDIPGDIFDIDSVMNLYITASKIWNKDTTVTNKIIKASAAAKINIDCNEMISGGGKNFELTNGATVNGRIGNYSEGTTSTYDGTSNLNLIVVNDQNNSNKMRLSNKDGVTIDLNVVVKTASATLTGAEASAYIVGNSASNITITVPETSTEIIGTGNHWYIYNGNTGDITIAKEGTDTLNGNTLVAPGDWAVITKRIVGSPNTYDISGGTSIQTYTIEHIVTGTIANGTYRFSRPRYDGTITNIYGILDSGTASLDVEISGVAVTHTTLSLSSTETNQAATANNTFDNSDYIDYKITNASSSDRLVLTLECTGRL